MYQWINDHSKEFRASPSLLYRTENYGKQFKFGTELFSMHQRFHITPGY
jgi:hypothetical protein